MEVEMEGMLTDAGDDEVCNLAVGAECILHRADIAHIALRHTKMGGNGRLRDPFGEEKFSELVRSARHCQARVSRLLCGSRKSISTTYVQYRRSRRLMREPKLLRCIRLLLQRRRPGACLVRLAWLRF